MKVAYVLRNFPVRSQTFVLNEILDHVEAGLDVDIYVLGSRDDADPVALDDRIARKVAYLEIPKRNRGRALRALRFASRHPLMFLRSWARRGDLGGSSYLVWGVVCLAGGLLGRSLHRYQIVHAHFGDTGQLVAAACRAAGFKGVVLASIHGFDISRDRFGDFGAYYRSVFRDCDRLLPVSDFWRQRLIANGCPAEKITVQHMGVDLPSPAPPTSSSQFVKLSCIGRMVEKKGHVYAVRAAADLLRRRPDLDIRFDIIGDGPLLPVVAEEVERLGLGDVVTLRGPQPHTQVLGSVAECDVFLLTSVTAADGDMEGIPVSLMEAMAMCKPVISSRHSGIPELVDDGRTGLLTPEADVPAISLAIERLAEDPSYRSELGAAGRRKVELEFDKRALGINLRQVYRSALERR